MKSELVSIIFGTVGRPQIAIALLQSIQKYTPPVQYEVIIVGGGEQSDTPVMKYLIKNNCKSVYFFQSAPGEGFSKAYNAGAKLATGKYLIWLNDDCEVTASWATHVLACMHSNPTIGVVGIPFNGDGRIKVRQTMMDKYVANFGCVSMALWEHLGGFDEAFHSYGAETDFCFRVMECGYAVVPCAACIHHHRIADEHHQQMVAEHRHSGSKMFISRWSRRARRFCIGKNMSTQRSFVHEAALGLR